MLDLRDKVIALTGASSGIGAELAVQLANRGARIAMCARRLERLRAAAARASQQGAGTPLVVACDVTDWKQVTGFAASVERALGPADIVIANAGRGSFGRFEEQSPDEVQAVVATNLVGVVYTLRGFLPQMLSQGRGRLVLISSVLGQLPAPQHAVYGATKFAVSGLAESLDYELRDRNVSVTLIEPSLVRSEFAQVSGTPLQRFKQVPSKSPEQVAAEIIRALEHERRYLVADGASRWVIAFRRHLPGLARVVFRLAIRRMYRRSVLSTE